MTHRLQHIMLGVAVLGVVLLPAPFVFDVIDTSIYILNEGMTQDEDLYLATERAQIDGVVDGDVVAAAGSVTITGVVTGDVLVLSQGRVHITGEVLGSLRGAARDVDIEGSVGDDVAVTALSTSISGQIERDVLIVGGSFQLTGNIARDLRGRFISGTLDGTIGNDVDITVQNLDVGSDFEIGGDLIYRSTRDADIATGATIGGQLIRLSSEGTFILELWLTIARAMSILAFLVSGIILLWLFRHTGARAAGLVRTKPLRSLLVGLAALLLAPIVIVLLVATIVGVPVAILLALLYALGLLMSPVPAVTAFGDRVLGGRGGLFGAFILGALVWRLGIEIIPLVGVALYLAALTWGTGGWVLAAWEERRRVAPPEPLLPPSMSISSHPTDLPNWEPPLPPSPGANPSQEVSHEGLQPQPGDPAIKLDAASPETRVAFENEPDAGQTLDTADEPDDT